MSLTPDISFRNMEPSVAVEARVREKVQWLSRHFDRLTHVRVTIEAPHRSHLKGKIYHVKIAMGVPGQPEMVINNEPEANHAHEDVYVAIRDAFDTARRRVDDIAEQRSPRARGSGRKGRG